MVSAQALLTFYIIIVFLTVTCTGLWYFQGTGTELAACKSGLGHPSKGSIYEKPG